MIEGIGHDLIEIERIGRMLAESPLRDKFMRRILTDTERELAERRGAKQAEFVAGRFAAKEAVVKALGCGIGSQVGFRDIEVIPDRLGKPICALSPSAWQRLGRDKPNGLRIHLSITHSDTMASAYAIIERCD